VPPLPLSSLYFSHLASPSVGVHNTDYVVDDAFLDNSGFKPAGSIASSGFETKVVKSTRRRDSSVGCAGDTGPPFERSTVMPPPLPSPAVSEEKNERVSRQVTRTPSLSSPPLLLSLDSDGLSERSRFTSLRPTPRNGRLKVNRIVGPEAYYMGIVDFQQLYNLSKKAERFVKIRVKGDSAEGLSCLEPVAYRQRFADCPTRR
jgi:hypothetical protein